MLSLANKKLIMCLLIHRFMLRRKILCFIALYVIRKSHRSVRQRRTEGITYSMLTKIPYQVSKLSRLLLVSDYECIRNVRMDRNTFARLCFLLRELGGLTDQRYVSVEEQVSMFLSVLAHHKKQTVLGTDYIRSSQTVHVYVHVVLKAILKLHNLFLVRPTPVPADSNNPRWKWFKGCLGAIDGTYIDVQVRPDDKPRYRTRKGRISTNVLGVCDTEMRFVYLLPGWEGSAADSRVLRDAVTRPNGLKVPKGNYYLCDNGYPNSEGFLAPYRGCRYHLKEWGPNTGRPTNPHEHFNMRHTRARNVIERAFGVLKKRFGILRSPSFYPIKTQIRLIMTCFLLHNFVRSVMPVDPLEQLIEENADDEHDAEPVEIIDTVETSNEWNIWREELANSMFQVWRSGG